MGEKSFLPVLVVCYVLCSAGNALTFKRMLYAYSDYEFFASQWNVLIYTVMAFAVVLVKWRHNGGGWLRKQRIGGRQLSIMGWLDCASSLLSCVGGAATSGDAQTVLNQALIPMTLAMSGALLGSRYSAKQYVGALLILCGAAYAVLPALLSGAAGSTTLVGASLYTLGVVPSAFSNVYKEAVFRDSDAAANTDVFYLTTCVSTLQVFAGLVFLPLLKFQAFGGVPLAEVPQQVSGGLAFFAGKGLRPMMDYCIVNFAFNILQLIITKHASAATLALCTALALPATSLLFATHFVMGDQAENFGARQGAALALVVAGFLVYSLSPDAGGRLPAQAAGGSAMYVRARPTVHSASTPSLSRLLKPEEVLPTRAKASSNKTLRELAGLQSPALPRGPHHARAASVRTPLVQR
ncbi:hypothetical protein M885DRAFT_526018 [Pelagophyceae sp. CCMP2097]|nr:hypothetical protein M885DRAFT_526018 [Pelagophyceae sp. CCMP2097]